MIIKDDEASALVAKIQEWLDDPQALLDKKSRRDVLEKVVFDYVDKIRRAERRRMFLKDILLWVGVPAAIWAWGPRLVELFEVISQ